MYFKGSQIKFQNCGVFLYLKVVLIWVCQSTGLGVYGIQKDNSRQICCKHGNSSVFMKDCKHDCEFKVTQ